MTRSFPEGRCPMCGGERVSGRVTFTADTGTGVVVVRHVPATVCEQCGTEWLDDATAAELEARTQEARRRGAQVEVVALP